MKKNLKLILIIGGALIIAVAALLLLLFLPKENKENPLDNIDPGTNISVATSDEGMLEAVVETTPQGELENNSYGTLIDSTPMKIKQVDVENEYGSFTVTSYTPTITETNEDGEEETKTDTTVYTLVGFEDFTLATGIPDKVANDAATLEFTKVANVKGENLSDYGLDKPRATATIQYTDGSKAVVKVGSVAPSEKGVYVAFGSTDTVYLVDEGEVDGYLVNLLEFFDPNINKAPDNENNARFSKITISGSNFPKEIVMVQNNSDTVSAYYKLTAPENVFVNVTEGSKITGGIRGLYAEEVVCVNPTDAQLEQYGLKTPYAKIKAEYPDTTVNLMASKPDSDGMVCLMTGGGKLIYKIKSDKVAWAVTSYDALMSEYVIYPKSDVITSLKVNDGANSYSFTVKTETKKTTDDDGNETSETIKTAFYGSKNLTLSNFEVMCQKLTELTRNDVVTATPSGPVVMSFEYGYSTDRANDVVTIYNDGKVDEYLAVLNGKSVGHVSKATVDKIKTYPAKVAKDEKITG